MYVTRKIKLNAIAWYFETAKNAIKALSKTYRRGVRFYFDEEERDSHISYAIWAEFLNNNDGDVMMYYQKIFYPAFNLAAQSVISGYTIAFNLPNPYLNEEENDWDNIIQKENNVIPEESNIIRRLARG
jgi:hypothetical protein